jgi:hypothetical protein
VFTICAVRVCILELQIRRKDFQGFSFSYFSLAICSHQDWTKQDIYHTMYVILFLINLVLCNLFFIRGEDWFVLEAHRLIHR